MSKQELLKIYELSCLNGHTKYKDVDRTLKEFFSDNFYLGTPRINCFDKLPIKKKEIISLNKKQNINTEQIIKNKKLYNEMMKKRCFLFNSRSEMFDIPKNLNEKESKKSSKNKSNKHINFADETIKNNLERLSFDGSNDFHIKFSASPKNSISHSNFLFNNNTNIQRKNHRFKTSRLIKDKNKTNNLQILSFSDYISSQLNEKSNNFSFNNSPNSTMTKTGLKNVSFKSNKENDSVSNEKNKNKIKKIKSVFSLNLNEDDNNNLNKNYKKRLAVVDDDIFIQSNYSRYSARKELQKNIKLKNLLSQISKSEKNDLFNPNEKNIKSKFNFIKKFKRDLFKNGIKTAEKNNIYYFRYRSPEKKFIRLSKVDKKNHFLNKNTKNLLNSLDKLQKYFKNHRNEIKNNNKKLDANILINYVNHIVNKKTFDKKIDEKFKKGAVAYQEKIGKFFIIRGCGIFSGHMNFMLRGDKDSNNLIKFDNI